MAGKAYAVTHSDAEWRQILTPEQYNVMRAHEPRRREAAPCSWKRDLAGFHAPPVVSRYSNQKESSKAEPAGPASTIRSRGLLRPPLIEPLAWSEPRFIARTAAAILGTSLTMARHPAICATALMG